MPHCPACLAAVELRALRCATCGQAFQGPRALPIVDPVVREGVSNEFGESVGATFSFEPSNGIDALLKALSGLPNTPNMMAFDRGTYDSMRAVYPDLPPFEEVEEDGMAVLRSADIAR